jgi:hypothetical protein
MKKIVFIPLLIFITILSSCCNCDEKTPNASDNATLNLNSNKENNGVDDAKPKEKKEVKMRTCDCCGREFPAKKGWNAVPTGMYNGVVIKSAKRYSNGRNCSKRCAEDCQ